MPPQRGRVGLEPGPGLVHRDGLGPFVALTGGRHDPQLVTIADDQPRAVAADVEPVDLGGDLGDLALAQVEPFQGGTR
jgi:hypothetical protein